MKKAITIWLMLVLTVALCACGVGQSDVNWSELVQQNGAASSVVDSADRSEVESKEFALGIVDETGYKNEFLGLGYRLNDGWTLCSEEEIRLRNNVTAELVGEEYEELMKEAEVVLDMVAVDQDELNNINVSIAKADLTPLEMLALDLKELYKQNLKELRTLYEEMGFQILDEEIIRISVDGKQLDAYRVTTENNGAKMFQVGFQRKCDGYFAAITVTTFFEDTTAQVLDNLYWL